MVFFFLGVFKCLVIYQLSKVEKKLNYNGYKTEGEKANLHIWVAGTSEVCIFSTWLINEIVKDPMRTCLRLLIKCPLWIISYIVSGIVFLQKQLNYLVKALRLKSTQSPLDLFKFPDVWICHYISFPEFHTSRRGPLSIHCRRVSA